MSKELAQTVGGKKVAWLIAILAAFAVVAALGSQWRQSEAAIITGLTLTSNPASGNVVPGQTVIYTATQPVDAAATNGTISITLPANVTYTASATCSEPDGGTPAPTGTTTISCTFSNSAGNAGNVVLTVPVTVNSTASGNIGTATATATDNTNTDSASLPASHLTVANVTAQGTTAAAGGTATVTFTLPAGLDVCNAVGGAQEDIPATAASVQINPATAATFVSSTASAGPPRTVTVTVQPAAGFTGSFTVALLTHLSNSTSTGNCAANGQSATANIVVPQLRHIADNGRVITQQEVNNNVRGSQHTICTVNPANNQGIQLPVGITLDNVVRTNGGGYASTTDTDPTFSDVIINTLNIGGQPATCVTWRSLDAGDQTISIIYVGLDGVNYNVLWNATQGVVKEWNRLEDSTVTLTVAGVPVSASGNSETTPLLTRTLPLVLNPLTGQYQGSTVTITDTFRGSHTNSAGQKEGPMPLAGVEWRVDRAPGSAACGTLTPTHTAGTWPQATTLLNTVAPAGSPNTHGVGNQPNVTFDPNGCAPGQRVLVRIQGREPGALGSGTGNVVTQIVEFTFVAQIPAKHVFLAWAGQRVVLEHNWAIDPSSLTSSAATCPNQGGFDVQYIKSSGPGAFLPGGTVTSIYTDSEAWASVTYEGGVETNGGEFAYPACTSVAVFESEDQGQVDIEAWIEDAPASKVAWVVYYMKIERVNLSLVTQVSKPAHNSSSLPDWAPGNPWNASQDDADGAAEWNVSKDILVRGRISGWFVNSNPSGRPADTSNPLNVLPANRWVMPADWPLLAGGPADPADGSNAIGTAEQFRPYYDIMIDPDPAKNGGRSLASPDGLGVYVSGLITNVATPNTGTGSSTSPISVGTCTNVTGNIIIGTVVKTVVSCTGTSLVISVPFSAPVAAGTPIFSIGGLPFIGPYSALDIFAAAPVAGPNQPNDGSLAPTSLPGHSFRDTVWKDGDVDWWDAPMPPAPVSVALRGTGFIKQVIKSDVYYTGTPNAAAVVNGGDQRYPNPYYWTEIPDSPAISAVAAGGGFLWDSFGTNGPAMGPYRFWVPVRIGVNSAGIGETLSSADITELGIIRTAYGDTTIARDLVVFSDNHGEFMVAANGDFKTDLSACATNALAGGKHCKPGDKVGKATITATADYPDFRGKHFPVASNAVTVDWTWGGYKDVTIEKGETDQFVYVVFHALDRDGFCSVPSGAVSLHPVLSSADAGNDFSSLGARYNGDPVENVDFLIDSGEGIIIAQSGGGAINDGKRFATGVTTFSVAANDPAVTGLKEFPLSPLAAQGQTDECQAWIKVSNSLLGIVNVLAIAKDDEGNIGFDRVIDLQTTTSYTLNFRWSLITWAGANNIPVMDAIKGTGKNDAGNDISASVTAIYGWDAAGQKWLGFFPAGVNVPGANDLTDLKTGEAYWIAITGPSSVTWTIATNVD